MTKDFADFLYLYNCGVFDIMPKENNYNIKKIINIAKNQEVLQIVFLSIKKLFNKNLIDLDKVIFLKLNQLFLSDVALNLSKTQNIYSTLSIFKENNIDYCLLKGDSIARFYAVKQTRISSDVDILIDEKDEKKAYDILKNLNFKMKNREKNDHHFAAISQNNEIIEVHIRLYSNSTRYILFDDKIKYNNDYIKIELENNVVVNTLNVYDNLVYLTTHFIKHFINSGVGIRQVSDLLLFMDYYKNEIDFDKYFALFDELNYLKLIATLMKIGNKYFNFSFCIPIDISDDLCDKLLSDIENGGVFGSEKIRPEKFFEFFLQKRSTKKVISKYRNNKLKRIFPNAKIMMIMYPILKEKPYLLLFKYFERVCKLVLRLFIKNKNVSDVSLHASEILKDFDII